MVEVVRLIFIALLATAGFEIATRSGTFTTNRTLLGVFLGAATGFVLSLGTQTPLYGWLFRIFPPMAGLRAAARFGNLVASITIMKKGTGTATPAEVLKKAHEHAGD